MVIRFGEILVRRGVLTEAQVREILDEQRETRRPFGLIAEERFGVAGDVIEDAWVEQYAMLTQHVDPTGEPFDERTRDLVSRRQAWQFQVLPVRFDGVDVMVATTPENLARAVRFAATCLTVPCYFVLASPEALRTTLQERYPMQGGLEHPILAES